MQPNPFYAVGDTHSPEERQLANRKYLHELESSKEGLTDLAKFAYENPRLGTSIGRLKLENPLMVGAGWDKFGEAVRGLTTLGFSAVEIGTIPLYAQDGNPQPRHFFPNDGVALNRYGFNSPGAEIVKQNLDAYAQDNVVIGINVGKNRDVILDEAPEVHAKAIEILYDHAAYFVINVSSPNTKDVRDQQAKAVLANIANAVQRVVRNRKPVFIKIAPELSPPEIEDVLEVVADHKLEGIIASNTTNNPSIKAEYGKEWRNEAGGLSGDSDAYRQLVNKQISFIYKQTNGSVPTIGVGGIKDVSSAIDKIKAGASALQIVTALNFSGPSLPGKINEGIIEYMDKYGIDNIDQLIGIAAE
jgi:dihydroorotate dehydrogenase